MYIVTGVSRGVGKAIVNQLLENGAKVIGVGRTNSISHSNYQFLECDLADLAAVEGLTFDLSDFNEVTLINNAGVIGDIIQLNQQSANSISEVMTINSITPVILTKNVFESVRNKNQFTLVNVSSGAGKKAIASWGPYCASKAALNMFTEVFFNETRELGYAPRIYAVSPGVIDTDMQSKIRSATKEQFSAVENFINMKENGMLFSPDECASRLLEMLTLEYDEQVYFDLRNL